MYRNPLITFFVLAISFYGMEAQAACTAGNPNANLIESTPTADFTIHGDGTVTHHLTGLMWKQCLQGRSGAGCTGSTLFMNWNAALQQATTDFTAGYSDWRLPNAKEQVTIVEDCGHTPPINREVFPNDPSLTHWSSTTWLGGNAGVWYVHAYNGYLLNGSFKVDNIGVRLVRGGRSIDSFDLLAPRLNAIGISATSRSDTILTATSDISGTGYWLVVAQGSAAPTAVETKAGVNYGAVTAVASGLGSMNAGVQASFIVSTLTALTAYDLYLIGYDDNNKAFSLVNKVSFSTNDSVSTNDTTTSDTTAASSGGGGSLDLSFLLGLMSLVFWFRRR